MAKKIELRAHFFRVRYIYILVYVLFTCLNKFIPFVTRMPGALGAAIYSALAVFGAVLLAVDFFTRRNMFRVRYNGLLLVFFGAYILSMLYNIRFGWVDNAKTLVWMLLQTLLLMAMDPEQSFEAHQKYLHLIFDAYILLWLVGTVWSFGQYVVQYYASHTAVEGDITPEGFVGGRLYGVFTDPNVAAVCSIMALLLAVFRMRHKIQALGWKVYYWVTIVFNLIYVILSGSRTGELILLGVVGLAAVFVCLSKTYSEQTKWFVKAGQRSLLIILSVALAFGGMRLAKLGLSYIPAVYGAAENVALPEQEEAQEEAVHQVDLTRPDVVDSDDVSNSRFKIWSDAWKLFETSPLLGTSARNHLAFAESHFGKEMYMVQRRYSVHNGYLSLLVYTGLLGAAAAAVWLCCAVWHVLGYLIRRRKMQDLYYWPVMYMTLVLFAVAVSAFPMMGIFFGNSVIEVLFWLIMGYTLCMIRLSDGQEGGKEPLLYRISESVAAKLSKKRDK